VYVCSRKSIGMIKRRAVSILLIGYIVVRDEESSQLVSPDDRLGLHDPFRGPRGGIVPGRSLAITSSYVIHVCHSSVTSLCPCRASAMMLDDLVS
jgi:hypothetical protein